MNSLLIIDDDPAMREMVCRWLRTIHGNGSMPSVLEAASLEDAQEIVARIPAEVVLLDLTLVPRHHPDDVIALLPELSRTWPPIVVLSGHANAAVMRTRCIEAGADGFISKMRAQENPMLLGEKLDNAIARRKARPL